MALHVLILTAIMLDDAFAFTIAAGARAYMPVPVPAPWPAPNTRLASAAALTGPHRVCCAQAM